MGPPDIGMVADVLGMSPRTLQRRLAEAGTGYARLLTQARFGMAVHLLATPRVKCVDIALELGYSDHAHFTRAFRQWTGTAPREFRRRTASAARPGPRARSVPNGA
jgi:AraC-like DNA-binding protein